MELNRIFTPDYDPPRGNVITGIRLIDGVPFYQDEYDFLINKRTEEEYQAIKEWVETELMPHMTRMTINENHSSYGLKHVAEKELGFYVSNGDIKLVLLEKGVQYKSCPNNPNTSYPLSEQFFKTTTDVLHLPYSERPKHWMTWRFTRTEKAKLYPDVLREKRSEVGPEGLYNDICISDLFFDIHRDVICFVIEPNAWYFNLGKFWIKDSKNIHGTKLCEAFINALNDHAKQHGEDEKIIEYVSGLCSKRRQADIIADAKSIAPRTLGDFYERKRER